MEQRKAEYGVWHVIYDSEDIEMIAKGGLEIANQEDIFEIICMGHTLNDGSWVIFCSSKTNSEWIPTALSMNHRTLRTKTEADALRMIEIISDNIK